MTKKKMFEMIEKRIAWLDRDVAENPSHTYSMSELGALRAIMRRCDQLKAENDQLRKELGMEDFDEQDGNRN